MNDQDKSGSGNLVPTGGTDLAPAAAANPLVSRGLADLAQVRLPDQSADIGLPCLKAYFCYRSGQLDEAIQLFDEVVRLHPDNTFALLHRGQAQLRKCRLTSDNQACDKAIKDFDQIIRIDPEYSSA